MWDFKAICDAVNAIKEKYIYETPEGARWPFYQQPHVRGRGGQIKISVPASLVRTAGYIVLGAEGVKLFPSKKPYEKSNVEQLQKFVLDLIAVLPNCGVS